MVICLVNLAIWSDPLPRITSSTTDNISQVVHNRLRRILWLFLRRRERLAELENKPGDA